MPGFRMSLTRAAFASSLVAFVSVSGPAHAVEPKLIEAAKKEGQVVWYTTLIVTQVVRPMVQAFEKKYPGIKVTFVPAPWQETALRLLNEGRAGTIKGDVTDGAATAYPLRDANLVERYVSEEAAAFAPEYKSPDGLWTANIVQVPTPAINTDAVSLKDAPRSYEDLLDPKWRERMGWTTSPTIAGPPGFIGNILMTMGHDKGMDYLKKLSQQKIANIPTNQRVVLDQNIAGQYPLVLSIYNYHAAISASQGAPVEWLKLDPTIVTFGTMILLKNSPHPNAAKLFVEFNASEEGQAVYREAGYIPVHPKVAAKTPALRPDSGKYPARIISPDTFNANEAEWIRIYKELFQ